MKSKRVGAWLGMISGLLGACLPLSAQTAAPASAPPGMGSLHPIVATLLPDGMIYCRLATFQSMNGWGDLAGQLESWINQGAQGIVLDLRANTTPGDFDGAAEVASLFTPEGTPLFTWQRAAEKPHAYVSAGPLPSSGLVLTTEPTAVLIDSQTNGAAKALAACLQSGGAILIGDRSSGKALNPAPPSPFGSVHLPSGESLDEQPLSPDIGLAADAKREALVLALIDQKRVEEVTREATASHRLSEAALVRGEDPEIDAYLVPVVPKGQAPAGSVPQDTVLVAALDSLKAIRLSQRPPVAPAPGDAFPASPSALQ